jgi:hypothetical protein
MTGVGLFVAIAGTSRSGKTKTALRLARGIAGPDGKIAAIDTEGRRMSHYSAEFDFDVFDMQSPFSAERFGEAAKAAEDAGYAVMVVDSFSLEWSGIGGVLDLYDTYFAAAGHQQTKSDICWARAKAKHKRMKDDLIQRTMPIIFCLRAKEVPVHLGGGWKVEQDKMFIFEWTVGLTLHPATPGMPRYDIVDSKKQPLWKVNAEHRGIFPEGKLIGEEAGAALQAWRNGEEARKAGSSAVGAIAGSVTYVEDEPPEGGVRPVPPLLQERMDKVAAKLAVTKTTAEVDAVERSAGRLIADLESEGLTSAVDALRAGFEAAKSNMEAV